MLKPSHKLGLEHGAFVNLPVVLFFERISKRPGTRLGQERARGTPHMQLKHRVLIAAQPAAALLLEEMLEELLELIRVQTIADGIIALQREAGRIDLIICTVLFDDSRMLEFLQAVKQDSSISGIPFVCCRLLPTVLAHDSMIRLGQVCTYLGAREFIDLPGLDKLHGVNAGKRAFRNAVMQCVESKERPAAP